MSARRKSFNEIRARLPATCRSDTLDPAAIDRSRAVTSPDATAVFHLCRRRPQRLGLRMMMAAGYENVVNVEGGTQAWYLAGLPVEQG